MHSVIILLVPSHANVIVVLVVMGSLVMISMNVMPVHVSMDLVLTLMVVLNVNVTMDTQNSKVNLKNLHAATSMNV
jgi:hypothetical protein